MEKKYIKVKNALVLEPSTNTHVLNAKSIEYREIEPGVMHVKTTSDAIITHGSMSRGHVEAGNHNTLTIGSKAFFKVVQQEFNPVTKEMQNAFD